MFLLFVIALACFETASYAIFVSSHRLFYDATDNENLDFSGDSCLFSYYRDII